MPTKVIDGVRHKMTRNMVRCGVCGDLLESKHRHDFKQCSCGNVHIDGGITDSCSVGWKGPYEDLSVWKPVS